VDIALASDAAMLAGRGTVDTIVLVSGDQDYVPLIHSLRHAGCRVIGIAGNQAALDLRPVCHRFIVAEYQLLPGSHRQQRCGYRIKHRGRKTCLSHLRVWPALRYNSNIRKRKRVLLWQGKILKKIIPAQQYLFGTIYWRDWTKQKKLQAKARKQSWLMTL
jgi:hypothetical protein